MSAVPATREATSTAALLVSHGTVQNLDDLGAFAANIRRGRPAPPELVAELRRRYEAIGGSPLNAITAEVARKLEAVLGIHVGWASRMWAPYARDVIGALAERGVRRIALVPLAQHSAHVYAADAKAAASAHGIELLCAPNWGLHDGLCEAFATRIAGALAAGAARACVVMTAHSLPRSVIDSGDPYESDVRGAAEKVAAAVLRRAAAPARFVVAFQSQGGAGVDGSSLQWLGPDLRSTLDQAAGRGERHVVVAPIGFLADHVEILYDLDIEARAMAEDRGLTFERTPSLNADDDFVRVLDDVVRSVLGLPRG
jgi:protoporphyrin/coproporphyrin ferrochelatase